MNLILHNLKLTNFKSFLGSHTFELERVPGLFYVTGKNRVNPELGANGVGKTAITCDALTWVLFNKTGRDSRPGAAIVPWDLGKGTSSVALTFTRLKRKQVLTRTRNPNSLDLDGRTIEQAEVEALIGMTEEMFRRTIVIGQFGSLFLDLKPEQQSQMFNEALNLDLWLRASVAASHKHKANTRKLDDLNIEQSSLTGRMAEINNSLEAERVARDEFEEQHAGHISRLKKQVAAKGQELASLAQGGQGQALAGQPYSPRAAPGQAGPSGAACRPTSHGPRYS